MSYKGFKHSEESKRKISKSIINYNLNNNYRSSEEIQAIKNQKPPSCECGCGKLVRWNKQGYRWNKYLIGHSGYVERRKQIKILKNQKPPLCACGCGKLTKWNKWENKWNKYLLNHKTRALSEKIQNLKNQKPPLCACGCGKPVKWSKKNNNQWNKYIERHWQKCPKYKKKLSQAIIKSYIDNPKKREMASKVRSKIWANPKFKEKTSGENSHQWKGGTGSKKKYPNSPVHQYAKQFNMTFEEAAQEFRKVCNNKIK